MEQCVNCNKPIEQEYCQYCGEKRFDVKWLSAKSLLNHLFVSLTEVDGKFLTSLRLLSFAPGQLTQDYMRGIRTHRINPFQLFLMINVVYFVFISVIHYNAFTTPLFTHMNAPNFIHQEIAVELVQQKVSSSDITLEAFSKEFNRLIALQSKTLLILLIPLFALILWFVFRREKHAGIMSIVYASHYVSAMLLFMIAFGLLSFVTYHLTSISIGVTAAMYLQSDPVVSGGLVLFSSWYFWRALQVNTSYSKLASFFIALFLVFGFYWVIIFYRMILFFTTFYSL